MGDRLGKRLTYTPERRAADIALQRAVLDGHEDSRAQLLVWCNRQLPSWIVHTFNQGYQPLDVEQVLGRCVEAIIEDDYKFIADWKAPGLTTRRQGKRRSSLNSWLRMLAHRKTVSYIREQNALKRAGNGGKLINRTYLLETPDHNDEIAYDHNGRVAAAESELEGELIASARHVGATCEEMVRMKLDPLTHKLSWNILNECLGLTKYEGEGLRKKLRVALQRRGVTPETALPLYDRPIAKPERARGSDEYDEESEDRMIATYFDNIYWQQWRRDPEGETDYWLYGFANKRGWYWADWMFNHKFFSHRPTVSEYIVGEARNVVQFSTIAEKPRFIA